MKFLTTLILITLLLFLFVTTAGADDIKYALSMFHFNIQYVCGGMEGLIPAPLPPFETWELTAVETEDMIVVESFEPIVDHFLAHPGWSVTLEMQGYFLDVLAQRHPAILEKLRDLADAGGAELVRFHYSDQLFIAYSYEDWRHSVELTIATFDRYDMPLSGTVFCQEGQASPGMATAMEEYGYQTMVWPKNLWKYQYGDFDATELYQHALRHKIGNLEAALTHMRFGEVSDRASKLEKEQERTTAKRDAAVVEPSGSTQAGSVAAKVGKDSPSSIREAFALAKKQLAS